MKLEPKLPPPPLRAGTVPETVTSVSMSPPAAPDTSCGARTRAGEPALSVPYWLLARLLTLICWPAAIWPLRTRWIS